MVRSQLQHTVEAVESSVKVAREDGEGPSRVIHPEDLIASLEKEVEVAIEVASEPRAKPWLDGWLPPGVTEIPDDFDWDSDYDSPDEGEDWNPEPPPYDPFAWLDEPGESEVMLFGKPVRLSTTGVEAISQEEVERATMAKTKFRRYPTADESQAEAESKEEGASQNEGDIQKEALVEDEVNAESEEDGAVDSQDEDTPVVEGEGALMPTDEGKDADYGAADPVDDGYLY